MKRNKTDIQQTSDDDRISSLPNPLILHILTFLDTKLAVQTTVLSKRWLHVWKYLPSLNIYTKSFPNISVFHTFITTLLVNHKTSAIDSLVFHDLPWLDDSMSIAARVVKYVASRQIKQMELKFLSDKYSSKHIPLSGKSLQILKLDGYVLTLPPLKLPSLKTLLLNYVTFDFNSPLTRSLLRCLSLEVLELTRCSRIPNSLASYKFTSLKSLRLHQTDISGRSNVKISEVPFDLFSGFVNLENLEISNCRISHSCSGFIISCPKLLNLKFLHATLCCAKKLIISAPRLASFEFKYDSFFCCGELVLVDTASLQIVDFYTTGKCRDPEFYIKKSKEDSFPLILNLFKDLSSVKSLYLSLDIIKLLSRFTNMLENQICPLDNLEILKVQVLQPKMVGCFQIAPEVFRYLSSGSPKLKEIGVLLE